MGFRDPITSLAADQITAGTLGADVVGRAIATADDGRRVVISTPAGDAGRVDFYADPDGPGQGEGHAAIAATTFGGVTSRAYLHVQADLGAELTVGSAQLPSGGFATSIDLDADILTAATRPPLRAAGAVRLPTNTANVSAETVVMSCAAVIPPGVPFRLTLSGRTNGTVVGDLVGISIRRGTFAGAIVEDILLRVDAVGGPGQVNKSATSREVFTDSDPHTPEALVVTVRRASGTGQVALVAGFTLIVDTEG
ncbi:MAG TPA: hypothetical protein VGC04_11215 [Cellulomonas sp.]